MTRRPVIPVLLGAAVHSRAAMQALAGSGILPIGLGPDPSLGHMCLDTIARLGLEGGFLQAETSDPADVARCFHDLRQAYGTLDGLVLLPTASVSSDAIVEVSVASLVTTLPRLITPWHAVLRSGLPTLGTASLLVLAVPDLAPSRNAAAAAAAGALHGIARSVQRDYGNTRRVVILDAGEPADLARNLVRAITGGKP